MEMSSSVSGYQPGLLAAMQTQTEIEVKLVEKALDVQKAAGQAMLELIDAVTQLGQNIDVTA